MSMDAKRVRRWKPRAHAGLQKIIYTVASLMAFAMAVGAGWRPMSK